MKDEYFAAIILAGVISGLGAAAFPTINIFLQIFLLTVIALVGIWYTMEK